MKPLPNSDKTILLRTDFSNDEVWNEICTAVRTPDPEMQEVLNATLGQSAGDVQTPIETIDDPEYRALTTERVLQLVPEPSAAILMIVVDQLAISHPDHPVLVVDVGIERGRMFRAIPSQVFGIESNLSIANMNWEEFADAVDDEGIFRGFDA